MPFEPFYHIRDGFAQFKSSDILHIHIICKNTLKKCEEELFQDIQLYKQFIQPVLKALPLQVKYINNPITPTSSRILITVILTASGGQRASKIGDHHYRIMNSTSNSFNPHQVQHEFVHILGVPHEIHNPLVHYCLKPNWQKILDWERTRDLELDRMYLQLQPQNPDMQVLGQWKWLKWHAERAIEDLYYCIRWTIFSDDVSRALTFDPYCCTGGSTDLFHLYMDKIPNTEDIFIDKGIVPDEMRLMTESLELFLKKRFANQGNFTDLKGRKPWFGDRDKDFLRRFLPDVYLQQMTYSNPFFKELIEDTYRCFEDLSLFRMDTLNRFVHLPNVDSFTMTKAYDAIATHRACNPRSHTNYISFWNKDLNRFSVCVSDHLKQHCAPTDTTTRRRQTSDLNNKESPKQREVQIVLWCVALLAIILPVMITFAPRRHSLKLGSKV